MTPHSPIDWCTLWELSDPHGVTVIIYYVTCGNGVKLHSKRRPEGVPLVATLQMKF